MDLDVKRLTECRKKMGISKQEAAKRIGVSQPAYLRYESGERTPSIQVIKEIAKEFHTSVDYLVNLSDSPEPDWILIERNNAPDLFSIAEKCAQMDQSQLDRLLKYVNMIYDISEALPHTSE
ncbi:MAG: helix-turn-helix transcriptional regulator [Lachnospiraceae bacterium]|nr:helix-turn-helix transcriptional regulator [Lachnospiraceae bacterium]